MARQLLDRASQRAVRAHRDLAHRSTIGKILLTSPQPAQGELRGTSDPEAGFLCGGHSAIARASRAQSRSSTGTDPADRPHGSLPNCDRVPADGQRRTSKAGNGR
jgi:hypothetical protein